MNVACECNCGIKPSVTQSCSKRRLLPVECAVQHYAWGQLGSKSLVARMSAVTHGTRINEDLPFAEMWLGAVENAAAARVTTSSFQTMDMSAFMERSYWSSSTLYRKFKLPFLFKLLSVRTALSIQAHPDKPLARRLHFADPAHYRDDNHKPELACALGEFEVLCGFRPRADIVRGVRSCPELLALVGSDAVRALELAHDEDEAKRCLRALFANLMEADSASVTKAVGTLGARLAVGAASDAEMLACRLLKQYPGDVGVFCAWLLNHMTLADGEAVFLPANEPHAYLQGDCVECMACSDNVVRAGLTPKWKDVNTLCDMLTYKMGAPELMRGELDESGKIRLYRPPVPEFQLRRLSIAAGERATLPASSSVGILVCCEGQGFAVDSTRHRYAMRAGFTLMVLPDTATTIEATSTMLLFCCQEQAGADRAAYTGKGASIPPAYPVEAAAPEPPPAGAVPSVAADTATVATGAVRPLLTEALQRENEALRLELQAVRSSRRWLGSLCVTLAAFSLGATVLAGGLATRRAR